MSVAYKRESRQQARPEPRPIARSDDPFFDEGYIPEDPDKPDRPVYEPPTEDVTSPTKRDTPRNGVGTPEGATKQVPSAPKKPRKKSKGKSKGRPRGAAVQRLPNGLTPNADNLWCLLSELGADEYNRLSEAERLRLLGGIDPSALSRAVKELFSREIISKARRSGKLYISLVDEYSEGYMSSSIGSLRYSAGRADRLSADGDPRETLSDAFHRWVTQHCVIDEIWDLFFPKSTKPTPREMDDMLRKCDGRVGPLLEMIVERIHKPRLVIDTPRSYVRKMLGLPNHHGKQKNQKSGMSFEYAP